MRNSGGEPIASADAEGVEGLLRAQRDLALELASATSLDAALQACLKAVIEISGMDSGGIYLFDEPTRSLDLACSIGMSERFVRDVAHFDSESLPVQLVIDGKPLYLGREELERFPGGAAKVEGLAVGAILPFGRDAQPLGALNVSAHAAGEVRPRRRNALEALAAQIGTAVARIQAEERLRRSEARHRWLTEHLTDVVWTSDLSLRMSYVSPSVFQQRGFTPEEVMAQSPEEIVTEESLQRARETLAAKLHGPVTEYLVPVMLDLEFLCKDGSTAPSEVKAALTIDESGKPTGILGVARDISARRRAEAEREVMEEQLRQSQKMEAIGTLAGGVAHDFNNLLTAILGSASVMRLRLPESSALRDDLGRIEKAAQRASELTRQLLGFARKGKLRHEPVEMHQIVEEVISILKHTIDKRIRITVEKIAAPSMVMGDPGQLEQVVLNLAVNASEAMPDGGTLTFSARTDEFESEEEAASVGVRPGRYVVTSVTDTGAGVPKGLRGRVFEPFFTTKPIGKGTGMGLAVAYGIVENHGGALTLADECVGGATFSVYLPAAEHLPRSEVALEDEVARGSGRILVVDDERVVCQTLAQILGALGYEVECVGNGSDALDLCADQDRRPDLVILDLAMPGMDGRECLRELHERAPELRVLVSTGQALAGEAAELERQGATGLLPKPYVARELALAVIEALNS